ncbi:MULTISPECIES: GtrA family protein [Novosphingobium]|uniref:GtrA family protein n=1 Tax=Novosphingobium TaxID=165696 RepID=UPI0006B906D1|nr:MULTISPECIES: GtrA family protein [Novosphingobium]KPF54183.1 polysaccharide biosynthesis protein GtrA [Novosphingobium sp. AAP1]MBB3359200.1 putative flippase GtrA [Novosphingobium sp. BK256]MBB3375319.1 putative flippase GtrA [Novosphingobium sp. BK280]MBB3379973.1 putative flippase GtrA [Novosphingobium sp. BK258]MBB3421667.1 putative flippase GtrA [Novosphingobium sp. BK267]
MTAMIMPLFQRLGQHTLVRYILASVGALAVDIGSFLALLALGVPAMAASALGYALGIAAHWLLSSRAVFAENVAASGPARLRQQALFVGSALVGLAITTLVVGGMVQLGLDPRTAKIVAIALSFAATWVLRKQVVFR